jgi:hypothetical protein
MRSGPSVEEPVSAVVSVGVARGELGERCSGMKRTSATGTERELSDSDDSNMLSWGLCVRERRDSKHGSGRSQEYMWRSRSISGGRAR